MGSPDFALFGQELNGATWALARMNMFLHARDAAPIEWCDTINSPRLVEGDHLMCFDVVVANPPFSLGKWGADHAAVRISTDASGGLFRPRPKATMPSSPTWWKSPSANRAVIVLHGVLFRGGAEGRIRQRLIDENLLDAVVGLPANLFTTTGIPVAVLIFDRSREQGGSNETRRDVLFIDASKDFTLGKTRNTMDEIHINKVLDSYRARTAVTQYAHLASPEEITENGYNLNIPRYVDTFEPEDEIDIAAVQQDIDRIEAELVEVRARMAGYLKELGIHTQKKSLMRKPLTREWRVKVEDPIV